MVIRMQQLEKIEKELNLLETYIKTFHVGYYPAFYLTLHHGINATDIFQLLLSDIYQMNDPDCLQVRSKVRIGKHEVVLSQTDRLTLSWYLMQRIPVAKANEADFSLPFCVNRQGKEVQSPSYRKALECAAKELKLDQKYTTRHIKAIYGYREIANGRKTVTEIADQFHCSKQHLIGHILGKFPIIYKEGLIYKIAGIDYNESNHLDCNETKHTTYKEEIK